MVVGSSASSFVDAAEVERAGFSDEARDLADGPAGAPVASVLDVGDDACEPDD